MERYVVGFKELILLNCPKQSIASMLALSKFQDSFHRNSKENSKIHKEPQKISNS